MNKEFLGRVQQHERTWGDEQYPSRPQLSDILAAKVVAFWLLTPKKGSTAERYVVTLHTGLNEIETWYLHAITRLHLQLPDRRLAAAYQDQKKVRVKSVKVVFDVAENEAE